VTSIASDVDFSAVEWLPVSPLPIAVVALCRASSRCDSSVIEARWNPGYRHMALFARIYPSPQSATVARWAYRLHFGVMQVWHDPGCALPWLNFRSDKSSSVV